MTLSNTSPSDAPTGVLRTPLLDVRCAPHCGGAVSHFVPRDNGQNQFPWNPPSQGIDRLTCYTPVGGWQDIAVWEGSGFPGAHWNRAFELERQKSEDGSVIRMTRTSEGVELTRTVKPDPARAALTVTTSCVNRTDRTLKQLRLQSHPILTPGGTRNPKTVVLWPTNESVETHAFSPPGMQPRRVGSLERQPAANWWACSDPDAAVTLLIEDPIGCTATQCLYQDPDLLILHNFSPTRDVAPGETADLTLTLRYYPLDLAPLASALGASRLLPERELLIGLKLSETEFAMGDAGEVSMRLSCVALSDPPAPQTGHLQIEDDDGRARFAQAVHLKPGDRPRLSTSTIRVPVGELPLGDYRAVFKLDGQPSEVRADFSIATETLRQRHDAARQRLTARLKSLAERVRPLDAGGLAVQLMLQDLETAKALCEQSALDAAERHAGWVEDALANLPSEASLPAFPWAHELTVSEDWLEAIESAVPEIPAHRRSADHYGSCQLDTFDHGWNFSTDACTAYALSWLFYHPASRYHQSTDALCRAVLLADYLCGSFEAGSLPRDLARDRNINRFTLGPLGEALRILLELPIHPARKAFWKRQYRQAAEYQIEHYGGQPVPEGGYLNQDVMYLLIMRFAHHMTGDARYLGECDAILGMIESQLLPDGAFYYKYPHNEIAGYHDINVTYLFRDGQLAGDDRGRALIARTRPYYPMMVSAGGWVEISTQSWWKHVSGTRWPFLGPAVVAGVTGDAHNQYLALQQPVRKQESAAGIERLLYAAQAARDDIEPEPPSDRFLILDRNVEGPRGRFGAFSWAGTTAPYRDTFVGALFSEAEAECAYAMHYAGPQVSYSQSNETNLHRGAGLAMSPAHYERDVVVRKDFAVLWARYDLHQVQQSLPEQADSDWIAEQLWYFDAHRLVGLLSLEPRRATAAHAVDLSVRFAQYGADGAHPQTELVRHDDGQYHSGPWGLRVIAHNLETLQIEDTWVCYYAGDAPGKGCFARTTPADGRFEPGKAYRMLVELRLRHHPPAMVHALKDPEKGFCLASPSGDLTVHAPASSPTGGAITVS